MLDFSVINFAGIDTDKFNDFFVTFFIGNDFLFIDLVLNLFRFEELEEDFVWTPPFFLKSLSFQEVDLDVINCQFSNGISKVLITIRVEVFILGDLLLKFMGDFFANHGDHISVDLGQIVLRELLVNLKVKRYVLVVG